MIDFLLMDLQPIISQKAINRLQFNKIQSIKHYCIYDKNLLKSS